MKKIKLNTVIFLTLFAIISITFLILFFSSITIFGKFGSYTQDMVRRSIKDFSDTVFRYDVFQQASIADSELSNALISLNFLEAELIRLLSKPALPDTIFKAKFKSDGDVFKYVSKKKVHSNGQDFGFVISAASNKTELPDKMFIELQKLKGLRNYLADLCLDTRHSIFSAFALARDGAILAFTMNPKSMSKAYSYDFFEKILPKYFDLPFNEKKTHFSKVYRDRLGRLAVNVYMPVIINGKENYIVGVSISYSKMIERLYDVFSNEEYDNYNPVKLLINRQGTIIYVKSEQVELFSLLDKNGEIVTDRKLKKGRDSFSILNRNIFDSSNPDIKGLASLIMKNDECQTDFVINGTPYMVVSKSIPSSNWYMAVMIKMDDLYSPLAKSEVEFNELSSYFYELYIIIFIVILIVALGVSFVGFRQIIVLPLKRLIDKFVHLGEGKFSNRIQEKGIAEVFTICKTYNELGRKLSEYTENLKTEVKNRQAIETELKIASSIQESVLPKVDEKFNNDYFMIYAKCEPAKDMSGDFYDFFYLNNENVAIVLADVSGKGISAAFYMSMAKAIIKSYCTLYRGSHENNPGALSKLINNFLSTNSNSCMFLTMYLCFYNIRTGQLNYTNAGHHEMICIKEDGELIPRGIMDQPAIGLINGIEYSSGEFTLEKGDKILLYTDGVIEAPDADNIEYGSERLLNILRANYSSELEQLSNIIFGDVTAYQENNKFDDVTIVMLERKE